MSTAQDEAFLSQPQPEPEQPEPAIVEETETIAEETPEPEPKDETKEETEEEKYSKRVQKRIDKEVYEKNELKRRIEVLEAQLSSPPAAAKTLPNGAPDPEQFAAGRYDPDYLEALTDYKVTLALDNQRIKSNVAENEKRVQKLITEAVEKYPDYEDVTEEFTSHPLAQVKEFTGLVMDSDNPVELAYYLGKNPQELNKLAEMTLAQAIRYLGRLEAQLNTSPTLESVKKPISTAPAPITPIKSASVTNSKDPERMSMAEYEAYRKKQMA
jgi:hypothetical protein